jgi:hypothetical protein
VRAKIGHVETEIPRYWLARMLYRVAAHGLRTGYAETYGGFFVDDRGEAIVLGLRTTDARAAVTLPRADAGLAIERLYRAIAPTGYKECPV